ncbi:hypothetical protein SODALDRAFT_69927 [Sodiomyces alkalinus F11]|uniref:Uncharacterized protein n=1 Tax=Sodiomyces alkalinus (strain CBS 110278 / VKM F-3762 / F11) TaxID=1314773 RepID=A0A3N2PM31_SODAK|nr:hypothetical protein SODALDRAFT_69927 [Sodiomyces alkalinus F11]ROT35568.1 hypothetical protein SODALDRAFT_69927 [Sodiomyces alkalinus F11]
MGQQGLWAGRNRDDTPPNGNMGWLPWAQVGVFGVSGSFWVFLTGGKGKGGITFFRFLLFYSPPSHSCDVFATAVTAVTAPSGIRDDILDGATVWWLCGCGQLFKRQRISRQGQLVKEMTPRCASFRPALCMNILQQNRMTGNGRHWLIHRGARHEHHTVTMVFILSK